MEPCVSNPIGIVDRAILQPSFRDKPSGSVLSEAEIKMIFTRRNRLPPIKTRVDDKVMSKFKSQLAQGNRDRLSIIQLDYDWTGLALEPWQRRWGDAVPDWNPATLKEDLKTMNGFLPPLWEEALATHPGPDIPYVLGTNMKMMNPEALECLIERFGPESPQLDPLHLEDILKFQNSGYVNTLPTEWLDKFNKAIEDAKKEQAEASLKRYG